jgi:hypothetical protein
MNESNEIISTIKAQIDKLKKQILNISPLALLGIAYPSMYMAAGSALTESELPREWYLHLRLLEFSHAVYASYTSENQIEEITQKQYEELMTLINSIDILQKQYLMHHDKRPELQAIDGIDPLKVYFWIHANWMTIRGNRYPQFQVPFMIMMLEPNKNLIEKFFNITWENFIKGLEQLLDTIFPGYFNAYQELQITLNNHINPTHLLGEIGIDTLSSLVKAPSTSALVKNKIQAFLQAKYLNLSSINSWPSKLLDELAYERGEANRFFDESHKSGWFTKTLPIKVKPFLKLNNNYYAFEQHLSIEGIYRAIQRAIQHFSKESIEEFNKRQANAAEKAFTSIFKNHLLGAEIHHQAFYKIDNNNWAETDCIIIIDDIMLVIECKAPAYTLASPIDNYSDHIKRIQEIIINAYNQSNRFIKYLSSQKNKGIFERINGKYIFKRKLDPNAFRKIIPIGISVENLTPYAEKLKQSLGSSSTEKYPFIQLSLDDLFPIADLLSTTGELIHYLETRQLQMKIEKLEIYGEVDYLGAYLNNFKPHEVVTINTQFDFINFPSFTKTIDEYYNKLLIADNPVNVAKPKRTYTPEIEKILKYIEAERPRNWLDINDVFRSMGPKQSALFEENLNGALQKRLGHILHQTGPFPMSILVIDSIWFFNEKEFILVGESRALSLGVDNYLVVALFYNKNKDISKIIYKRFNKPSNTLVNFSYLNYKSKETNKLTDNAVKSEAIKMKLGRNDRCPCGSDKKYKKCHGK